MISPRSMTASSLINGNWWIAGGEPTISSDTSELYKPGHSAFDQFYNLPMPMNRHTMAPLNDKEVILVGFDYPSPSNDVFLFNWNSKTFRKLSSMKTKRYAVAAGNA